MKPLAEYIPKASSWFASTLTYTGRGRIEFSNPRGWIEGDATCEVNSGGEMSLNFEVERWENTEAPSNLPPITNRDWLLSGIRVNDDLDFPWRMYFIPQVTENTITSLYLSTSEGDGLKSKRILHYEWDPLAGVVHLYIDEAIYIAHERFKVEAKYWVLPCINLNMRPFGSIQAYQYTNLRRHPLRIFPVSEETEAFLNSDASEQDRLWVRHRVLALGYMVCFFYNEKPAFIEQLPQYAQTIEKLQTGIARMGVTSVMIGKYSSEDDEIRPLSLLPVLGIASERPIGASWIEYRDEDANLIYRLHGNMGFYTYEHGTSVINDVIHQGGVGKLLTAASNSTTTFQALVRGALHNAAKAISSDDVSIIFYYAFTAFESLFKYYDIERDIHPLKSFLSQTQIDTIETILSQAKLDIEQLETQISDIDLSVSKKQIEVISKVAGKVRSLPLDTRVQFGDKLIALIESVGLADIEVLAAYFGKIGIWASKVNEYRNMTMHETHFQNVSDLDVITSFEQITPHIIDLLVRVLLKTIGYTGEYAPFMESPNSSRNVSWVEPATPPSGLGYK